MLINKAQPPVFIGGTNGSGTRVYARLLNAAGVFQGVDPNFAFEPESIRKHTRPTVPKLMQASNGPIYKLESLPQDIRDLMENWLQKYARTIVSDMPEHYQRWGWKHPRNIFLAPFLEALFEGCYFLHVIRDGRDMSLATNKGDFLTMNSRFSHKFEESPIGAAGFWSKINTELHDWAVLNFKNRYVYSRFEDLCERPEIEAERLLVRLGLNFNVTVEDFCKEIIQPETIGRWRGLDEFDRSKVEDAARPGLSMFGYLS